MSLKLPTAPGAGMFKQGMNSYNSEDGVVNRNIAAVREIAEMVRTSVGPAGRNKVIVNHLEKIFVTSDASTILREIDIVHPAVKVLVMASQQQDMELGDASNLVVVLAGEFLNQAEELLRIGMSTSEIVQGFEIAASYAAKSLETQVTNQKGTLNNPDELEVILRTVIAPKLYGEEDIPATLVAQAVAHVMPNDPLAFNVDAVRVVKIMGGGLMNSQVVKGMVFPTSPEGSVKSVENAKVAVFTGPVDISQTETKGTVLLHNAKEMLEFSKGEEQQVEEVVRKLKEDLNVGVVVAGAGVGALTLHYFNRFGILVFRVPSKFDLQRLCRVTGSTPLPTFNVNGPEDLGAIDRVRIEEIGGDRVTVFEQNEASTRTATIVLRGATQNHLDAVERAVDDAVNAVKALTKDTAIVPGAGASEIAVALDVHAEGEKNSSITQHAIKKYARAFEALPRTLAENAGLDGNACLSVLYAEHTKGNKLAGVNIDGTSPSLDAVKEGIMDIYLAKRNAIQLATQAAITILSVDQIIMAKRAGGPTVPQQRGDWDQD